MFKLIKHTEQEPVTSVVDELTCPICFCQFTSPVLLECGHTFCEECIACVISDSTRVPTCPCCRRYIMTASHRHLVPNLVIRNILAIKSVLNRTAEGSIRLTQDRVDPVGATVAISGITFHLTVTPRHSVNTRYIAVQVTADEPITAHITVDLTNDIEGRNIARRDRVEFTGEHTRHSFMVGPRHTVFAAESGFMDAGREIEFSYKITEAEAGVRTVKSVLEQARRSATFIEIEEIYDLVGDSPDIHQLATFVRDFPMPLVNDGDKAISFRRAILSIPDIIDTLIDQIDSDDAITVLGSDLDIINGFDDQTVADDESEFSSDPLAQTIRPRLDCTPEAVESEIDLTSALPASSFDDVEIVDVSCFRPAPTPAPTQVECLMGLLENLAGDMAALRSKIESDSATADCLERQLAAEYDAMAYKM